MNAQPTPTLKGKDAKRFLDRMENRARIDPAECKRAKEVYEAVGEPHNGKE